MFKKEANNVTKVIEQWGSIIHNDLTRLHEDNLDRSKSKREKEIISRLQGFKASLCLGSCSGLLYILDETVYKNPHDINIDSDEQKDEVLITTAIDVDYLVTFIDDILNKRW